MLRIRLSRVGKKNKAQFRITVADGHRAPTGKFIEILGHYNPHTKEKVFKQERVEYWISKGAKPSATIHNFLVDAGIVKGKKVTSWKPKKKKGEDKPTEKKTEKKVVETEKKVEEKTEEKVEEKKVVESEKEKAGEEKTEETKK
ncbi:MAG: 30S ribosomal protein S16 [Candidatus Pacebacteria bacterium]|nr:30S ribosomal protein S16 [Candidatus Paceibacterota bacterium]